MGRLPRNIEDGLVYHPLNRGDNRAYLFLDDADRLGFLEALALSKQHDPFRLFGYCLMTDHRHLLLGPEPGQSISRILQSFTVAQTWRYHRRHRSSGHVWQGLFRSLVIQDDSHLRVDLHYIEANPLRARMVVELADYPWSSHQGHGMGKDDPVLGDLPKCVEPGATKAERRHPWWSKIRSEQNRSELAEVRDSLPDGRPFGDARWTSLLAKRPCIVSNPRPRKE